MSAVVILLPLLVVQTVMLVVLTLRLLPGRTRRPPVAPRPNATTLESVTVVVASLNEAKRIQPCLDGLMAQTAPLLEVLVVDSRSTDGTRELVEAAAARDPRIRLLTDDPLPDGWVGKVWALETGLREARGEWVLGIDADTVPVPGLVGGVVAAARRDRFDVVSFSPCFEGQSAGERFVQPAMLTTLVYRCGAAGATQPPPDRVLANGQCFLARRALLEQHGGYSSARLSFSDDVTLARHLAAHGARVGFLDGSAIYRVRSYASLGEMWREWGRSFDLKDATPRWQRWLDVTLVWAVQALPVPMLLWLLLVAYRLADAPLALVLLGLMPGGMLLINVLAGLLLVNAIALSIRLALLVALRGSYAERGLSFWCSWLADVPAAIRLTLSTMRTPRRWRGRQYDALTPSLG
ncbi:MAG: glycosyltransferase family 2 protein [Gemmatimonadaceae bacterium]